MKNCLRWNQWKKLWYPPPPPPSSYMYIRFLLCIGVCWHCSIWHYLQSSIVNILDSIYSFFFVFWHMQLYMSWCIISFFGLIRTYSLFFLSYPVITSSIDIVFVLSISYRGNHICHLNNPSKVSKLILWLIYNQNNQNGYSMGYNVYIPWDPVYNTVKISRRKHNSTATHNGCVTYRAPLILWLKHLRLPDVTLGLYHFTR